MPPEPLEAFGERFNKRAKRQVFFDPTDEILEPGLISLGSEMLAVDEILGGGLPRGRTSMIIGEPSSGKTLLAQLFIAAAQRQGGTAVYIDAEHTYSRRWFEATGVECTKDKLSIGRPLYLEEAFDSIIEVIEKTSPAIVVIDSLPALLPKALVEAEMMKQDFRGVFPRKVSEGIGKLTGANMNTAVVIINQMRVSMGVTFGNPESIPGGLALKHYVTMTIRVRRGRWLTAVAGVENDLTAFGEVAEQPEKDAKKVGFMLRLRTDKNKMASPWQEAELRFKFTGAIDPLGSIVSLAIERGIIVGGAAGYYRITGYEHSVHGREALEKLLRGDVELRASIIKAVREAGR
jgi:recombination protein RecA